LLSETKHWVNAPPDPDSVYVGCNILGCLGHLEKISEHAKAQPASKVGYHGLRVSLVLNLFSVKPSSAMMLPGLTLLKVVALAGQKGGICVS
jgi:hypothetical protein